MDCTPETFDRDQYHVLKRAVDALAGVCDGAMLRDDQGFDGSDTRAGHLYAFLPIEAWPLCAFYRAWRWAKKYHGQLAKMCIDCTSLPEPPTFEGETRQIALHPDGGFFVIVPNDDWDLLSAFRAMRGSVFHKVPIGGSDKLFYRYRTYCGNGAALLSFAEQYHFQLGPGVREHALTFEGTATGAQPDNRLVYEREEDSFALYFLDRSLNAEVRTIPYRSYSYIGGFHWVIDARRQVAGPLRAFLEKHAFVVPDDAQQRLQELEQPVSRQDLYQ